MVRYAVYSGWYIFVGTLFLRPEAIDHTPARLFYQREVFLSTSEDRTFNLASVTGKCCVLYSKDFANCMYNTLNKLK